MKYEIEPGGWRPALFVEKFLESVPLFDKFCKLIPL